VIVARPRARRLSAAWWLLEPYFDGDDRIPVVDDHGNRFQLARGELREALAGGAPVHSVSGSRLDVALLEAGRLL
jgi:hypothetical protein